MGLFDKVQRTAREELSDDMTNARDVMIAHDGDHPDAVTLDMVAGTLDPIGDRVLIRPDETAEMTDSKLLFIPEVAKDKSMRGTVVAVGDDPLLQGLSRAGVPAKLVEGDRVIYGKYSGTEIEHAGEKLLIVRYPDLLAVIR